MVVWCGVVWCGVVGLGVKPAGLPSETKRKINCLSIMSVGNYPLGALEHIHVIRRPARGGEEEGTVRRGRGCGALGSAPPPPVPPLSPG